MKQAGLKARLVQVTRRQPGLKRFQSKGQNLLLAMDRPTAVNQIWVADVTYLKVNGQWQYLSTIMDQYSRRIIGWSLSSSRTAELTKATLDYALKKRGYPRNVIFHTDRGVEFMANDFQEMLARHQFKHSVNRPGYCSDNAYMESFYHSLKAELIRGTDFRSVKDLWRKIARYLNGFYNSRRLHSGLNYMSPVEFEAMTA
jgi:transposase InsO family protein